MKPKPFSPLNHFTEPVAIENPLLSWPDLARFSGGHGRWLLRARGISKALLVVPSGENNSAALTARAVFWSGTRSGHTLFTRPFVPIVGPLVPTERKGHP